MIQGACLKYFANGNTTNTSAVQRKKRIHSAHSSESEANNHIPNSTFGAVQALVDNQQNIEITISGHIVKLEPETMTDKGKTLLRGKNY